MNTDDLVERIGQVVNARLSAQPTSDGRGGEALYMIDLKLESLLDPPFFNDQQIQTLRSYAIDLLNAEESGSSWELVQILAVGGAKGYEAELETSVDLTPHPTDPLPDGWVNSPYIRLSLLDEMGVLEEGERPLFYEYGSLFVKDTKAGRSGTLYITDRRVIVVGAYHSQWKATARHIYYEDWEEKPYLSSLDYVYIDKLMRPENKKHQIKAKYHTKYWEEKQRTFYGPYFFRIDLPSTVSTKEGEVDIYIVASKSRQTPKSEQVRRNGAIYERLMQLRSKSGPELV